jgi:hypothetical protein
MTCQVFRLDGCFVVGYAFELDRAVASVGFRAQRRQSAGALIQDGASCSEGYTGSSSSAGIAAMLLTENICRPSSC